MGHSGEIASTRVVPLMRYRDLSTAVDWLVAAFGFTVHFVASDQDGSIIYAQMTYGNGMVMLGPVRQSNFDKLLSQPDEIGGTETQSCYLVVEDIEDHYDRAKSAGAEIALDLRDDVAGGRAYACRDCEGHIWNFGTFDPWANTSLYANSARACEAPRRKPPSAIRSLAAVFAGLAIAGTAIGLYGRSPQPRDVLGNLTYLDELESNESRQQTSPSLSRSPQVPSVPARVMVALRDELAQERAARQAAERSVVAIRSELASQRSLREQAQRRSRDMRDELVHAVGAKEAALTTLARVRKYHVLDLRAAGATVDELRSMIAGERQAKEAALRALHEAEAELGKQRTLRREAAHAVDTKEPKKPQAKLPAKPPVSGATGTNKDASDVSPEKEPKPAGDTSNPASGGSTGSISENNAKQAAAAEKAAAEQKQKAAQRRRERRSKTKSNTSSYAKKKSTPKPVAKESQKGWPYNTW